jgi:cytochrome c oxidase assembly factor CtaG
VTPYAWHAHWDVLLGLAALVAVYVRAARAFPPSHLRVASFVVSQLLLYAVFLTPVETISLHYLLSVHLLQNVVVAEWSPGLLVLGIAPALARRLERVRTVRLVTHPLVALPVWLGTYFAWHVPVVYDAALEHGSSLLHAEHVSYFVAGSLLWWPVVHGRSADGAKAAYLFTAFVLASPLGLLLALLPHPIYPFYERAPRLWGLSHTTDQEIAGVTMAVEQALVFFAVFALYLSRFMRSESIVGAYTVSGSRR